MKNRAKCKICLSVIESFHSMDYVVCKCGEIAVSEGLAMRAHARDFNNLLRVDDEGNEVVVKVIEDNKEKVQDDSPKNKPTREELIAELDRLLETIDALPSNAMGTPITHYDFYCALFLLTTILKEEKKPVKKKPTKKPTKGKKTTLPKTPLPRTSDHEELKSGS